MSKCTTGNRIYLSLKTKGFFELKQNKTLGSLFDTTQIATAHITSIEEDQEKNLWLGSDIGLIKINKDRDKFTIFDKNDGIYNNYFFPNSSYTDKKDLMYFGGDNGFISFNPKSIKKSKKKFKVVFTDFYLQNQLIFPYSQNSNGFVLTKPINELSQIELNYKNSIIGFKFTATDFSDSHQMNYYYRLLGFNDSWNKIDTRSRLTTYTNLNPGNYTFQVKAMDKNSNWSENIKEIAIIKSPAPWLTIWAYIFYISSILFTMLLYFKIKNRNVLLQKKHLENQINSRTKELKDQKQIVEKLLKQQKELFANITHEFKTPLTLILGNVDSLLSRIELIKDYQKLKTIKSQANRLLVMVGHILNISQASEVNNNKTNQNIKEVITSLTDAYKPLAESKNITLTTTLLVDENVYVSQYGLEIIISNLLSNAFKYTQQGGHIKVFTTPKDKLVLISIEDNGIGIEENDLKHIFKRFKRVENNLNVQGTGLGLSVVKSLIEANQGTISVESINGEGSKFTVGLVKSNSFESASTNRVLINTSIINNTQIELARLTPIQKHRKTRNQTSILIIEDNIDMQRHINEILSEVYYCQFANRGSKGIALAIKYIPDIIICDIMMPNMDGYEVTERIRKEPKTSHIPIILLTALNAE